MIPARLGSKRLPRKNLCKINDVTLLARAARKCKAANIFDSIWINSESLVFKKIAEEESVLFHHRPSDLADDNATSEQFVKEFLISHNCDWIVQVHSIAPFLTIKEIHKFVEFLKKCDADVVLSYEPIQIECAFNDEPINFNFEEKTNSQNISPIQRISWSITAWKRASFLAASETGFCATYAGKVDYFCLSQYSSHVIKTKEDLKIAEALLPLIEGV